MCVRSSCDAAFARVLICLCVMALGLLTAACSAVARPEATANPADPRAPAKTAAYRPVLGGYVSRRPVDPAPWREQNERVTPAPKP
jgi:hypothetical protein